MEVSKSANLDGDDERTENERSPDLEKKSEQKIETEDGSSCSIEVPSSRRAHRPRRPNRYNRNAANMCSRGTPHRGLDRQENRNGKSDSDDTLKPKRRNNRKRGNRKYNNKPYDRLSWKEKEELDDMESRRAVRKHANRPTPYNTTQFLMADHKVLTPDLSVGGGNHIQMDSSDELFEQDEFVKTQQREFSAMYEEVQSERLHSMTKEELVAEVLILSKRVSELEELTADNRTSDGENMNVHSIGARVKSLRVLEHSVQRLREENLLL